MIPYIWEFFFFYGYNIWNSEWLCLLRWEFMASKLVQLQSKASQASQFVAKHGCAYYKQLMEQNKQYIQEPPTVEKCNLLSKQLFYTRLARLVYQITPTIYISIFLVIQSNLLGPLYYFAFSFPWSLMVWDCNFDDSQLY